MGRKKPGPKPKKKQPQVEKDNTIYHIKIASTFFIVSLLLIAALLRFGSSELIDGLLWYTIYAIVFFGVGLILLRITIFGEKKNS